MGRAAEMQEAAARSIAHYGKCLDVLTAKVAYCKATFHLLNDLDIKSSPHDWTSDFYLWAAVNCK